jgi:hypothetical protein
MMILLMIYMKMKDLNMKCIQIINNNINIVVKNILGFLI